MVGNGDELRVERLLQLFKVFNTSRQHQFILHTIFQAGIISFIEVTGIKEIIVSHILINIVTIPETTNITVENSTSVAFFCPRIAGAAWKELSLPSFERDQQVNQIVLFQAYFPHHSFCLDQLHSRNCRRTWYFYHHKDYLERCNFLTID